MLRLADTKIDWDAYMSQVLAQMLAGFLLFRVKDLEFGTKM
jgi:hypothetical protein